MKNAWPVWVFVSYSPEEASPIDAVEFNSKPRDYSQNAYRPHGSAGSLTPDPRPFIVHVIKKKDGH
jgi:hypothetical protein